ncbi:MAG: hypothetical protein GY731_20210, partial [Gammaproteobacteria bacterium]|nr:hypothetical protein [Gammaproteobacteria bacterium]
MKIPTNLLILALLMPVLILWSHGVQGACGLIPGTYPLAGGDKITVEKNVTMNGNGVAKGDYNGDYVIDINGAPSVVSQSLPDLDPDTFPANSSGTDGDETDSPFNSSSEVFYKEIKIGQNKTATFTGGGPFHIDKLVGEKNSTINLAAGTYYINELTLDQGVDLYVTSEPVIIHIGTKFETGKNSDINQGGSVTGLRVYLHTDAEFIALQGADFEGIVYGPNSKLIKLEKNVNIHGLVTTGGELTLEQGVSITYTADDQAAVSGTSTCAGVDTVDHFALSHDGYGINCLGETIQVTPKDNSGVDFSGYTGTIVLDTQSGKGSWTATTGNGTLTDATANDGLATYTFSGSETLPVGFTLDYQEGVGTINIDVYESGAPTIRDDD